MELFMFKGASGIVGTVASSDGVGLPDVYGPWRFLKELQINSGDEPRIGANSDEIIDSVEKNGFHLRPEGTDADRT